MADFVPLLGLTRHSDGEAAAGRRAGGSVLHLEGGAVLGLGLASDVEPGGADMGMAGPMLEIVEIGAVVAGIADRGDPHGVGADPDGFLGDPGFLGIFSDDIAGNAVGGELAGCAFRQVAAKRAEQRAFEVVAMAGLVQIVLDQAAGEGMRRDKTDPVAFAFDLEMRDAFTRGEVLNAKVAELGAAKAMEEEGGENGPVTLAL